jgi:hypothetical protein
MDPTRRRSLLVVRPPLDTRQSGVENSFGCMQESQRGAEYTLIPDLPHTLRIRLRCAIALQPGLVNNLTSLGHYAEGLGNLRANDLAG